jgi:dihydroxyacid dehydratase/phosphogluconate dehydratase
VLHGYPLDGVVLTTGCDKTTPAALMAAATVNIPAIVLSGGPMLDGYFDGQRVGSGTVIWHARKLFAKGTIDYEGFVALVAASAPSAGHCNTMGTALSMNCIAEALGMSLPGCAAIPAPYRERAQMAYATGKRAVELVREELTPARVMTRAAFENAIVAASAIGASSNCPPHLIAIARHMGVALDLADWQSIGHEIPLLVNCQPVGEFLGEGFHRAGGLPAVMAELLAAGKVHGEALTVSGRTLAEDLAGAPRPDRAVVKAYANPLRERAGYLVLSGNLFDSAVMKVSAIDDAFRARYLANPGDPEAFEARAIVFDGPEDYHARINDPALGVDTGCVLFIRNCGPVGYPGSAEVVNMQPPDALIQQGVESLPTCGDGRQSGTSASPSILNASPEAAVGGGLALLQTGDRVRVDLKTRRVDVQLPPEELQRRRAAWRAPQLESQTPWQEIYRQLVGQLSTGGCLESATLFLDVVERRGNPRHSH